MRQQHIQLALIGLSIVAMASIWGWLPAIIIIGMIYFHEVGHQQTAKFFGAKVGGIYMLPFLGGVAIINERLPRFENALVYLGGPLFGLIYSAAVVIIGKTLNLPDITSIGGICAYINIFNLLPVVPLDGGGVLQEIAFSIHKNAGKFVMLASIAIAAAAAIYIKAPIFFVIVVLGMMNYAGEKARRFSSRDMKYSEMGFILLAWMALFIGLATILVRSVG
jgi:Zn-dependent protease